LSYTKKIISMTEELSKIARWLFIIIAIPAGLYLGKQFLAPLAIGIVLAMMLIPVMDWLLSKKVSKGLAIAGSTLILLMFFVIIGGLVAIQVKMISKDWPQIEKTSLKVLDDTQQFIEEKSGLNPDEQLKQAKGLLAKMGSGGSAAIGTIGGTFANLILVIVYVVLLLSQRERFKKFVLLNVPKENHHRVRKALKEIRKTSGGYFWGMFKAMIILAVLYGVGFAIGGIKYAFLLAVIAAVFSFIPYLGNAIGGGLAAILALVSGGPSSVLAVVIVMFAAQMVDNYITQPYVVGKEVDLNPFMTITSVIAFGALWGVAGAIIAIPITGIIKVSFQYFPNTESFAFMMGNSKPELGIEPIKEEADKVER